MTDKKTITTIFIIPTLKINRDDLAKNGFLNGYMKDERRDVQYTDSVYLLFQPRDLDKFKLFLDSEYERTKFIVDDYNYEDGFVVLVYKLNMKFRKDFDLVMKGKYSQTSPSFQSMFPKIVKVKKNGIWKEEMSLQHRAFNKTDDLRKYWEEKLGVDFDESMEVWEGFIEENEILNLDKLKKNV